MAVEQDMALFEEHREQWSAEHPGKIVLIREGEVAGFFDTLDDALSEGTRRFGLVPFLARSVSEPDQEVSVPALALGVLHTDPTYAV